MNPLMMLGNNGNSQIPQVSKEQVSFVKELLSKKGISAETWVRQLCAQKNINVDDFMSQFKDVSL